MANINEIIKAAQSFGIKLANAELGTEFCLRWTDRVAVAKAQPFPAGESRELSSSAANRRPVGFPFRGGGARDFNSGLTMIRHGRFAYMSPVTLAPPAMFPRGLFVPASLRVSSQPPWSIDAPEARLICNLPRHRNRVGASRRPWPTVA